MYAALAENWLLVTLWTAAGGVVSPMALRLLLAYFPAHLLAGRYVAVGLRLWPVLMASLVTGLAAVTAVIAPSIRRALDKGVKVADVRATALWNRRAACLAALQFAGATPVLYLLGLAVFSFAALVAADLGYQPENVVSISIPETAPRLPPSGDVQDRNEGYVAWVRQLQRVMDAAAKVPSVVSVSSSIDRPGLDPGFSGGRIWLPGADQEGDSVEAGMGIVGGDYFDVMQIPLRAGRVFDSRLQLTMPRRGWDNTVIDMALARALGHGEDLVGREILINGFPTKVLGVVGNIKPNRPDEAPQPRYYLAVEPYKSIAFVLLVRFAGPPAAGEAAGRMIAKIVQEEYDSPRKPYVSLLTDELRFLQADYRGRYEILSIAGATATALAGFGVFGIGAYTVARRRRELAIRLAVGASGRQVLWICVRGVVGASAVGIGVGLLIGFALARRAASMLYAVSPVNPAVLAGTAFAAIAIATAGAAVPIRNAWRTDVSAILREQ